VSNRRSARNKTGKVHSRRFAKKEMDWKLGTPPHKLSRRARNSKGELATWASSSKTNKRYGTPHLMVKAGIGKCMGFWL